MKDDLLKATATDSRGANGEMQSDRDARKRDNLSNVPRERQCGAKTRAGGPCRNWGMQPSGRCRMHGGKSYGGIASPTFKHGWHSTYPPFSAVRKQIEQRIETERRVAARMEAIRAEREARDEMQGERGSGSISAPIIIWPLHWEGTSPPAIGIHNTGQTSPKTADCRQTP